MGHNKFIVQSASASTLPVDVLCSKTLDVYERSITRELLNDGNIYTI
jgi:hypothetical protein